jgi:hypothetical protein
LRNMAGWMTFCALLSASQGCISVHFEGRRKFATQEAAIAQFHAHEQEYRQIAEEWLGGSHEEFCRFGSDDYKWNNYWISSTWFAWEVMHWDGHEHVKQPASSFDEAATLAGVSPATVRYWMRKISSLSVDCISRRGVAVATQKSEYIELEFYPAIHPYGFRYAPGNDSVSHNVLALWATRVSQKPFQRLVSLGGPWFYFEGYRNGGPLPLSQVSGTLRDHQGLPAFGIRVDLVKLRDNGRIDWPSDTRTDSDGRFHFSGLTAGKYLLGINLREDPSAEVPYRRTYFPGTGNRQQATILEVQEMASLVVKPFRLPSQLARRRVTVQVTWPDGRPDVDARLCRRASEDAFCTPLAPVANQAGMYSFVGFEDVEYRVRATTHHEIVLFLSTFGKQILVPNPFRFHFGPRRQR